MISNKFTWVIITLISGAILPIQAGLNSKLGRAANSPIHASMISFIIGTVALIIYISFTKQSFSWVGLKTAPAQAWIGGLLGAFYVTMIIFSFQNLGPGLTFGLIVTGQMLVSIFLEHYNILVVQSQNISLARVLGVILIIVGVILIRKF